MQRMKKTASRHHSFAEDKTGRVWILSADDGG